MAPLKRKKKVLTLAEKMSLIQKHEKGANISSLALCYGIGVQTVRDIIKNRLKLETFVLSSDTLKASDTRKSMKESTFKKLDEQMIKWFLQKRSEGIPISGPMCVAQAQSFHKMLGISEPFNASSGWLYRFKRRHGIRELEIHGEKLDANEVGMVEFCYDLENLILEHKLKPEQIYNADETGCYWKAIPTRTLASEGEKSAPGFKIKKDRLTVMCCANASGTHKLKLVVIGKSKSPRALKDLKTLPVHYYSQKSAWIDRTIFKEWFFKQFIPQVKNFLSENNLPPEAVLLLDNAPSHPEASILKSEDGKIFVVFFPPNVTSIAQPMDQGVIEKMKRLYRKKFMMQLLNGDSDIKTFWKKFNIKDAIFCMSNSWECLTPENIKRAFSKIMTLESDETFDCSVELEEESVENLLVIARQINGLKDMTVEAMEEWCKMDSKDANHEYLADEVSLVSSSEEEEEGNDSIDSDIPQCSTVTHGKALECVNILLTYYESQKDADILNTIHLKKMSDSIRKDLEKTRKQTKLTDYFSK